MPILIFVIGWTQAVFSQIDLVNVGHTNDGGTAFSIAVSSNYAYLATGADGLRIYDISNPTMPVNVGHANDGGYELGIAVSGHYAYLAGEYDGLRIYDISDPTNPINIGHAYNGGGGDFGIAARDHYVFLSCNGLGIYDVADPTNPVQVAHGLVGAFALAFSNNFVYASNPNTAHTLYAYDVSNPAGPTTNYVSGSGYIFGLANSGHYLFAGAESFHLTNGVSISGLLAFDISNPTNPVYLATSGGAGYEGGQVVVSSNLVYWANGNYGLQVYDVSNPTGTNIVKLGEIKGGRAQDVALSGHYAYVANNTDGLRVYAITPHVNTTLTSSNAVLVSWPAAGSFLVQESPDLTGSNWITISNSPNIVGGNAQLLLPASNTNLFYRLISQ